MSTEKFQSLWSSERHTDWETDDWATKFQVRIKVVVIGS